MNPRPFAALVPAAALLALATGCSSQPSGSKDFPPNVVADYAGGFRGLIGPEQKVISTGETFCTELRHGVPVAQAVAELQAAWDDPDGAVMMASTAVGDRHSLCPDQARTFDAWFVNWTPSSAG